MYYDAMKNGGKSAQYMVDRLQYLKDNLDEENALVTDGFVDADVKLVNALDHMINNPMLNEILDKDMHADADLKKRVITQAAKDVVDRNTGESLLSSLTGQSDDIHRTMIRTVDALFDEESSPLKYGTVDE